MAVLREGRGDENKSKLNSTRLVGKPDFDFLLACKMALGYLLTEFQLV
jgi:hypothetical protein